MKINLQTLQPFSRKSHPIYLSTCSGKQIVPFPGAAAARTKLSAPLIQWPLASLSGPAQRPGFVLFIMGPEYTTEVYLNVSIKYHVIYRGWLISCCSSCSAFPGFCLANQISFSSRLWVTLNALMNSAALKVISATINRTDELWWRPSWQTFLFIPWHSAMRRRRERKGGVSASAVTLK